MQPGGTSTTSPTATGWAARRSRTRGESPDRDYKVVNDGVHDCPRLKPGLAIEVDLLRSHDDD